MLDASQLGHPGLELCSLLLRDARAFSSQRALEEMCVSYVLNAGEKSVKGAFPSQHPGRLLYQGLAFVCVLLSKKRGGLVWSSLPHRFP